MGILVAAETVLFLRLAHPPLGLVLATAAGERVFEGELATVVVPGLQVIAGHAVIAEIEILSVGDEIDLCAVHAVEFEAHLVGVRPLGQVDCLDYD